MTDNGRHLPNPNKSCVALDTVVAEVVVAVEVAFLVAVLGEGEELLLPGALGRGFGEALVPRLVGLFTSAGNSTVPLVCMKKGMLAENIIKLRKKKPSLTIPASSNVM